MTENSGGTFQTPILSEDMSVVSESVGEPYQGVEAKILDKDGNVVPKGTIGELVTKGYFLFNGYVNDDEKTKESFTEDGFFKTGDLALLREDGMLKITGREKDLIIRGGENIQPTEIEDYINEMPAVKASFVIGVPSKRLDEEVAVYIQLNEGASITIDDVKAHCKNGLARFKHPKYIKFEDTYPLTTTGKVQKFLLQKQALEDFPELKDEIQE
ncbi:Oidioi.mRNA.OKI2018_I69.chr2.g7335.t1.cds [Oikopleura dioica]|uniref:Medium-chain acyl-CoA ligase ACSF2, mitochondrial n=1 Tax=Oikopleura dioica TaxID=34765 RepID=A0ABN7T6B2_OIKDI|nr:Oidioi.mRNA.OKI2018_I69.chr2.g7335.t1.cds [Oikopleura dioica]